MKVNDRTRQAVAVRREERRMIALGYGKHETNYEIHRGPREKWRWIITDAVISVDGKYVWTKVGPKEP